MLVLRRIGRGQSAYYLDGPETGRWMGNGCAPLGLVGAVDEAGLDRLLGGFHPQGGPLLARVPVNRRAGFDLILAAPKSFSLLAALAPVEQRSLLESAHQASVRDTLGYLERRAARTLRGPRQDRIPATGLVAAAFCHHQSSAGDPHLHSHVVIANAGLVPDGSWACLDQLALYRHRQAAGAVYLASLRHHVAVAGFHLPWVQHQNGLADVAAVPRAAIIACSTRRQQVVAANRDTPRARSVTAARLRTTPPSTATSWSERAAAAGMDGEAAERILRRGLIELPAHADPPDPRVVRQSLLTGASTFSEADCVRHVAMHADGGAPSMMIEQWAAGYLRDAVPSRAGRWTSPAYRQMEDRIVAWTGAPWAGAGMARPDAVVETLAARPGLSEAGRQAVTALTSSGVGVQRLGEGPLLAQAAVLEAAGEAWGASGHRVAIISRSERAQQRWRAVTGIGPAPLPPAYPTVVIVDSVDRVPTADIHRVLADAEARRAKVVLVEGGTSPLRRPPDSPAIDRLRAATVAIDPGSPASLSPAPAVVRGGRLASVLVAQTAPDTISSLVTDWAQMTTAGRGPPTMIALGPEEAGALNDAAREVLLARGQLSGPSVTAGSHQWSVGDQIRVLRRDRRLGPFPAGTVGTVVAVDAQSASVSIRWPKDTTEMAAATLGRCPATYAYATTPAYGRHAPGPVLALGDPEGRPDGTVYVVAANRRQLTHEVGPDAIRRRRSEALATATELRPTETVLAHLGPPPDGEHEREAWRRAAVAIESYRSRWDVPDRPRRLDLGESGVGIEPGREVDRRRVLSACQAASRALERAQAVDRRLTLVEP